MNMTCEQITDILPELAAGTLSSADAAAVRAHVASCDVCAAEWSLISSLRLEPSVPADLADRISMAVRARPVSRPFWGAGQLAVAATIAVALIGGGIAIQQVALETRHAVPSPQVAESTAPSDTPVSSTSTDAAVAVPAVETPALGARSVLSDMSEAQLEALLKEMGS